MLPKCFKIFSLYKFTTGGSIGHELKSAYYWKRLKFISFSHVWSLGRGITGLAFWRWWLFSSSEEKDLLSSGQPFFVFSVLRERFWSFIFLLWLLWLSKLYINTHSIWFAIWKGSCLICSCFWIFGIITHVTNSPFLGHFVVVRWTNFVGW